MGQFRDGPGAAAVVRAEAPRDAGADRLDRPFGLGHRGQKTAGSARPPSAQRRQAGRGVARQGGGVAGFNRIRRKAGPGDAGVPRGLAAMGLHTAGLRDPFSLAKARQLGIRLHFADRNKHTEISQKISVGDLRLRRRRG